MKRLALQMAQDCGLFALTRAASKRMARVLMYHNFSSSAATDRDAVAVAEARRQLAYLKRHFQVLPLPRIVSKLKAGLAIDPHTVVLTIDDGRRNCYELFFPLLREFQIPATFYVVTSFIEGEDWIWTDKVLWLSEQPRPPADLVPNHINSFFEKLNQMRPEIRNARILDVAAEMRLTIPCEPPSKYAPCSWSALREMSDSGLVEIGSHTITHPILSTLTDRECTEELVASRTQLEGELNKEVHSFCIPNGKPADYRLNQLQQIVDAGYQSAVVTRFGLASRNSDPYELPRIGISGETDMLSFTKYLTGTEHYQERLLR